MDGSPPTQGAAGASPGRARRERLHAHAHFRRASFCRGEVGARVGMARGDHRGARRDARDTLKLKDPICRNAVEGVQRVLTIRARRREAPPPRKALPLGPSRMARLPLLALACAAWRARASANRSHILLAVIDDLGWADVGFRAGDIATPALDALAARAGSCSSACTRRACARRRARALLSGVLPLHSGLHDYLDDSSAGLRSARMPLGAARATRARSPTPARARIYATLADDLRAQVAPRRVQVGVPADVPRLRLVLRLLRRRPGLLLARRRGRLRPAPRPAPRCGANCGELRWDDRGAYSTALFGARAVDVVEAHDGGRPLFLELAFQAVHAPAEAPPRAARCAAPYARNATATHRATFAAMLACADEALANVTAALAARGMLDSTVVVVTSDNGGPVGGVGGDDVGASNFPLRGGKHSIFDGGLRVTALVAGGIATPLAAVAGEPSRAQLMHIVDWRATLLEAVGGGAPSLAGDGVSQWRVLVGGAGAAAARGEAYLGLYDDNLGGEALLDGTSGWKLLRGGANQTLCRLGACCCNNLTGTTATNGNCPAFWSPDPLADATADRARARARGRARALAARRSRTLLGDAMRTEVQLFNVRRDPGETTDAALAEPAVTAAMIARLDEALLDRRGLAAAQRSRVRLVGAVQRHPRRPRTVPWAVVRLTETCPETAGASRACR